MVKRVLLVDDEPQLLRSLRINLKARRYRVATAADGTAALAEAAGHPPDAVILDLGLPDMRGLDVITNLRRSTRVPIIVLTGRTEPAAAVEALDAGADDYVTKPFCVDELAARLRAVMRRVAAPADGGPDLVRVGAYTVDLATCTAKPASGQGGTLRLTPTEWRLLILLLRNPGHLVTAGQLLREVWGPGHEDHTNYLRVHFSALRHKLEPDPAHPRHLITAPGMGYRFQP
jgi:two-component system, OmpR family, KDP operon response regulator KdpE